MPFPSMFSSDELDMKTTSHFRVRQFFCTGCFVYIAGLRMQFWIQWEYDLKQNPLQVRKHRKCNLVRLIFVKMGGVEFLPIGDNRNLGFITALSSAACEWVLIFLLLLDTAFSYLLTMFADFCKLQLPCLLCSRHNKSKPYYNILCKNHRSEISSLVSCHTHEKLADVRGLCEDCLLSYAAQNKSNSESYRLLVGRLGLDLGGYGNLQNQLRENDEQIRNPIAICSCCGKVWNAERLFQINKPNKSSPFPRNRLNRRNGLKKKRKIISRSRTYNCRLGKNEFDPLSHEGYSEVNAVPEAFSSEHVSETPGSMLLDLNSPSEASQSTKPSASEFSGWHGLRELNWLHVYQKSTPPDVPELISLDDPLEPCIDHGNALRSSNSDASALIIDLSVTETGGSRSLPNHMDSCDHGNDSRPSNSDASSLKLIPTVTENALSQSSPNHMDSGDAVSPLREPCIDRGNISIYSNSEARTLKSDLTARSRSLPNHRGLRIGEDASSSLDRHEKNDFNSKESTPMESESSYFAGSTTPTFDRSSSESRLLQKPGFLERSESTGFESVDGNSVSIDKLKQKIECDRIIMNSLYKELEEERSASAIATNQAMAMITRLQEEKATLRLESLQCLRMMEEQAEYDVHALQKANDLLLAERDKDIQDLEAELEFSRNRHETLITTENITGHDSVEKPLNSNNYEDLHGVGLRDEVSELGERIKSLESGFGFLMNRSGSFVNGEEGLQFMEEIAHYLHELHEIGKRLPFFQPS